MVRHTGLKICDERCAPSGSGVGNVDDGVARWSEQASHLSEDVLQLVEVARVVPVPRGVAGERVLEVAVGWHVRRGCEAEVDLNGQHPAHPSRITDYKFAGSIQASRRGMGSSLQQ